jgi:transposase
MTKAARIVFLREGGLKYREIAELCDCGVGYVSAAVQRHKAGGSRVCDERYREKFKEKHGKHHGGNFYRKRREATHA